MYSLYGVRAWTVPKLEHYLGQYGVRRSKLLFIFIFDVHIGHKMDINSSTIIVPITRIFLTTIIYLHCGLAHIFFKRELKVTSGANKNLLVNIGCFIVLLAHQRLMRKVRQNVAPVAQLVSA